MLIAPYPDGCVVVRLVCYGCGWQRIIGYSGWNYHSKTWTRALIRIAPTDSRCNLVSTAIREIQHPTRDPNLEIQLDNYRDMQQEAHEMGLHRMGSQFDELLVERKCPRCDLSGRVKLGTHRFSGYVDLSPYRTWRLIRS